MHFLSIILTACLAFVSTINGTPTSSKTSSVSTKHSTTSSTKTPSSSSQHSTTLSTKTSSSSSKSASATPTCVTETYDINVSLRSIQAVEFMVNSSQFDERAVSLIILFDAVGLEKNIVSRPEHFKTVPYTGYESGSPPLHFLRQPLSLGTPCTTQDIVRSPTEANFPPQPQLFNSWNVDDPIVGTIPHSSPNLILTAVDQQVTNGTPSLTVLYSGSKIKSFDFHSFWFGCAANNVQPAASAVIACTITVAGFRNNMEVAVASYSFTPTVGMVSAPMIQAVLPKTFVNLQNVTLIQADPTEQVLTADDFNITTHTC